MNTMRMQGTVELDDDHMLVMGVFREADGRLWFVGPQLKAGDKVPVGAVLVYRGLYSEYKERDIWRRKRIYKHFRFTIYRATESGLEEVVDGIDFPKKCQKAALRLFEEFVSAHRSELLAAVPPQLRGFSAEGLEFIGNGVSEALYSIDNEPLCWEEVAAACLPVLDRVRFFSLVRFLRLFRNPAHEGMATIPPEEARTEIENILLLEAVSGRRTPEFIRDSLWQAFNIITEEAESK